MLPVARIPLNLAVVTVSDTRTMETDTSGALLAEKLRAEGHQLHSRNIVKDDVYQLRALLSKLIADPEVQGVLTTGGTGFTARDNTRKAVAPLFDVEIEGFGELFRQISFTEIGSSTVQSRAFGGIANGTAIFCLPGSTGACRTGWDRILREQLDSTHKPCNFAERI